MELLPLRSGRKRLIRWKQNAQNKSRFINVETIDYVVKRIIKGTERAQLGGVGKRMKSEVSEKVRKCW